MRVHSDDYPVHVVIPDTQAKPGVPTDHLEWIGRYIVEHFAGHPNLKVVHLGDHADMPSLSSYDKGKRAMEGRRVIADIDAANHAFDVLNEPLNMYNATRRRWKEAQWWPERHILMGNHEDRISRATEDQAQLDGFLSLDLLNYERSGWTAHPYLKPVFLDGVAYCHFFANPMTGRPYGGAALTRLKTMGHSFSMGHQQTLDYALRTVHGPDGPHTQHALVAGACYLHMEDYKGVWGNDHWRGIVVCHDVVNGSYNPMFINLDYLARRYAGMPVNDYLQEINYQSDLAA